VLLVKSKENIFFYHNKQFFIGILKRPKQRIRLKNLLWLIEENIYVVIFHNFIRSILRNFRVISPCF